MIAVVLVLKSLSGEVTGDGSWKIMRLVKYRSIAKTHNASLPLSIKRPLIHRADAAS